MKNLRVCRRRTAFCVAFADICGLWSVAEVTRALSDFADAAVEAALGRSEEHTSELQSLMRISYAVFCLKKKNIRQNTRQTNRQDEYNKTHRYVTTYEHR